MPFRNNCRIEKRKYPCVMYFFLFQLDMNLALEKVNYLKGVIARSCRIPHEKQVLLISGGESLDSEERYVILKRII